MVTMPAELLRVHPVVLDEEATLAGLSLGLLLP